MNSAIDHGYLNRHVTGNSHLSVVRDLYINLFFLFTAYHISTDNQKLRCQKGSDKNINGCVDEGQGI